MSSGFFFEQTVSFHYKFVSKEDYLMNRCVQSFILRLRS